MVTVVIGAAENLANVRMLAKAYEHVGEMR